MKWILFVVMVAGGSTAPGMTSETLEFKTRDQCEEVARQVRDRFKNLSPRTACFFVPQEGEAAPPAEK